MTKPYVPASPVVPANDALPSIEKTVAPDAPIPTEVQAKMEKMKGMLDTFKEKLLAKFEGYVLGLALAPPEKEGERKDKVNVLILVDDQDSTKMSKDELHDKLTKAMGAVAKDVDDDIAVDVVLLTEFWQSCFDGKYELAQVIALSAPIHDTGWLAAIKLCEIHKSMVLKKFEKYIACYVLGGSLVRGKANPNSDIDVYIVIDDTDVKKMSRAELKDKLRGIINDMAFQAGQMTGIPNKLSIQPYILTDFWDNMKEANPIIFTFLRDGIPFYDRGVFMPWKQLLKMGRIRPSPEAIDLHRQLGDQILDRVRLKLKDIAVEDFWYALINPSQAALMLNGQAPPAPREIPDAMRESFVKHKLFEEKHVKFLETVIKTHKDVEYGIRKQVTGTEIQEMLEKSEEYLKALKALYSEIEQKKELESIQHVYESTVTVVRDVLKSEGVEKAAEAELAKRFEEIVHKGVVPERYLRLLRDIQKAKKDYDAGKLTKTEVVEIQKTAGEFFKTMVEHIQRKRARELERARVRFMHGGKTAEMLLLGDTAYIIPDVAAEQKEIQSSFIGKDGSLGDFSTSDFETLEHAMATAAPGKMALHEATIASLRKRFGAIEILLGW
jgi:uncharacterized protein (UPF0332 family)/predicted nucleotidyltransferase